MRSLTTRQYARLVGQWIASIGLDPLKFGTHSLWRTMATFDLSPHRELPGQSTFARPISAWKAQ
jgi:hypothetical protein